MGLVEITAGQGDLRQSMELLLRAICFRTLWNAGRGSRALALVLLAGEQLNETPFAQADLIGDVRDGAIREAPKIADGEVYRGCGGSSGMNYFFQKSTLERSKLGFRSLGFQQALAQMAGLDAPQVSSETSVSLQLAGRQV